MFKAFARRAVLAAAVSAVAFGTMGFQSNDGEDRRVRIINATAKKLGMGLDKVILTLDRHGNTSAASVPIAFDEGVRDGRIKPGQLVLLEAFGGGFAWGSALVRL